MALSGRARSTRALVILLVTASLVTITVDYKEGTNGPLSRLGSAALSIIAPLQQGVSDVLRPVGTFFSSITHAFSLADENRRLKQQLQQYAGIVNEKKALEEELVRSNDLLAVKQTLDVQTIGAQVISNGVDDLEWSITIDKGSRDGVEVGMPVIAAEGLVGKVFQVGLTGSEVQLLIDPDMQVAASVLGSTQAGALQGQGPDEPVLHYISPTAPIHQGDLVQTTNYSIGDLTGRFPPNISIGVVAHAERIPGALEKDVTIRPNVDFTSLDLVLVVLSTGSK